MHDRGFLFSLRVLYFLISYNRYSNTPISFIIRNVIKIDLKGLYFCLKSLITFISSLDDSVVAKFSHSRCGIWLCLHESVLSVWSLFRNNPAHWWVTHFLHPHRKQTPCQGTEAATVVTPEEHWIQDTRQGLGYMEWLRLHREQVPDCPKPQGLRPCFLPFCIPSSSQRGQPTQQTTTKCLLEEGGCDVSKSWKVEEGSWALKVQKGLAFLKDTRGWLPIVMAPPVTHPSTHVHFQLWLAASIIESQKLYDPIVWIWMGLDLFSPKDYGRSNGAFVLGLDPQRHCISTCPLRSLPALPPGAQSWVSLLQGQGEGGVEAPGQPPPRRPADVGRKQMREEARPRPEQLTSWAQPKLLTHTALSQLHVFLSHWVMGDVWHIDLYFSFWISIYL